jgi:hypothetical protein
MRLLAVSKLLRTHARSTGHPGLRRFCTERTMKYLIYIYTHNIWLWHFECDYAIVFFWRKFHMNFYYNRYCLYKASTLRLILCGASVYEKHTMQRLVYNLSAYSFAFSISDNEDAREHILYSGPTIWHSHFQPPWNLNMLLTNGSSMHFFIAVLFATNRICIWHQPFGLETFAFAAV